MLRCGEGYSQWPSTVIHDYTSVSLHVWEEGIWKEAAVGRNLPSELSNLFIDLFKTLSALRKLHSFEWYCCDWRTGLFYGTGTITTLRWKRWEKSRKSCQYSQSPSQDSNPRSSGKTALFLFIRTLHWTPPASDTALLNSIRHIHLCCVRIL